MDSITYSPLNQNRQDIRLVCLHPGEWVDPVSISVEISSLYSDDLPFFEAVSYTWDNPTEKGSIIYSGRRISVTKSAHNVLRRLRLAKSIRYEVMKNLEGPNVTNVMHKSAVD
jgi:hypothetical protein